MVECKPLQHGRLGVDGAAAAGVAEDGVTRTDEAGSCTHSICSSTASVSAVPVDGLAVDGELRA